MDAHAITMKGPYHAENKDIAVFNAPADERKIRYWNDNLYFGSSGWQKLGIKYNAVPQNAILLFDADTAVYGFTLLTNIDDELAYAQIAGTNGGGGASRTGSTWNQPTHLHSQSQHTHDISTHQHYFTGTTGDSPAGSDTHYGGARLEMYVHQHLFYGYTDPGGGITSNNTLINTGIDNIGISWRPKGRNFTRQQRT